MNIGLDFDFAASGMSDLLSPFVVLFEDNADAFWCFEMLLRRTVNTYYNCVQMTFPFATFYFHLVIEKCTTDDSSA